ncbi:AIPR family protein [Streptosporangium sp. V21-05]|uniref:AIPR family protein n=1 Tax=Streptosporangium sp. V21-05 TaxID=3446115 RepID=UPI003F536CA2
MTKPAVMPTPVRQVREALKREFSGMIDLSDLDRRSEDQREQNFLSRALAALAVRSLTGCDNVAAAGMVIDDFDDQGIDAIAFIEGMPRLWLIQAKWSDKGTARFAKGEALKQVDGLRLIDHHRFDRFNLRFQRLVEPIKAILDNPRLRITLVVVQMTDQQPSPDSLTPFTDIATEFNRYDEVLDHRFLLTKDVWRIVRDDLAEPQISLAVPMTEWAHFAEPYEAYQGTVAVADVAQWHEDHGVQLYHKNIRTPLGLTQVNLGLVETLTKYPQDFWYFNNGITVLCDEISRTQWSRSAMGPIRLDLTGASVVNGAQTVAEIHRAMGKNPAGAALACVQVKVISTRGCPSGFADELTKATNTQNRVESRDFVALDPVQARIRVDFALSLGKTYVVKRGEMDPSPDDGCSVVHAATALACAHHNPELAARAKQNQELLWEDDSQGAYPMLFGEQPSADQIWRSVLLWRAVRSALHAGRSDWEGRAGAIAERGDYLVTHLVFQYAGLEGIEDSSSGWEEVLPQIPDLIKRVLSWLVYHVDREFGTSSLISSTFTNPERCRVLATRVLSDLRAGTDVPQLAPEYQPTANGNRPRQPNAVPTLVDARRIPDGTLLVLTPGSKPEQTAIGDWLSADQSRSQVTWVNSRGKPLLWSADGERYSPSGLVKRIRELAGWDESPVAAEGTKRWAIPGDGTLAELAAEVLRSRESDD